MRRFGLTMPLLAALFCLPAAGQEPRSWTLPPAEATKAFETAWRRVERREPELTARNLILLATEAAAARWRPERLDVALTLLRELQDTKTDSPTFGNLRWYLRESMVRDRNAVEFVVQTAVVLAAEHTAGLTPRGRETLATILRDAAIGIRRHRVGEDYTNIFLMKTANCVLLGEHLGDAELAAEGRSMLRRWLTYTLTHGVPEHNSPTYTGVDLDCLALLARRASRPEDRRLAEAGLRLIWTEAAAHWFAPCQRLGGAHSRDYDYLTGRGSFDAQAWVAGWLPRRPAGEGVGGRPAPVAMTARSWRPADDWVRPLLATAPAMVHQRWGKEPWQRSAHYRGRRFSLGSSGASRAFDDKVFTLNLAGDADTPMGCFVLDGRDDAYGKRREIGKDGHAKALHLIPFVASVQDGAEVLLLASDDPTMPKHRRPVERLAGLWSHLVLPTASRLCDARGATLSAGELPPAAPLFLRLGDVAVGIRFLHRRGSDGREAGLRLVRDGDRWAAQRLTVTHAGGEKIPGRGTVAFWVRGVEGIDDAGFARFAASFAAAAATASDTAGRIRLRVTGVNGPLQLDVEPARQLYHRASAPNAPPADFLLTVNGRERWRPILDEALRGARGDGSVQPRGASSAGVRN